MDSIVWLIVFIVLLLIEILTLGLTTIWFCIGALAAFIATLFNAGYVVQTILFVVVSLLSLVVTRPIAVKYLNKDRVKTNVDEVIGKTAVITKRIDDAQGIGEAELEGDKWLACSVDGAVLEAGEKAEVVRVEGVKLLLKKA